MKKVLIIVRDASETLDTLYPFYRLQEAGTERAKKAQDYVNSLNQKCVGTLEENF